MPGDEHVAWTGFLFRVEICDDVPPGVPTRTLLVALAIAVVVAFGVLGAISAAEHRALDAESEHVAQQLGSAPCLTDWGVDEGAGPRRDASVTGVTAASIRVDVTIPYAYTTETDDGAVYADTASEATYEVSLAGLRRVRGDDVSPC
ncbi:hypothetical protein SAMN04488133_0209 [Halobellus limi]|uniref:Uncharacterized protein n=1 Tax=Halobellus limi TaxID=699433 RepID=A0A1H5T8P2_9EURY|nr:hypothetical protein SAMN04488133_0209 [Halobellus limi]